MADRPEFEPDEQTLIDHLMSNASMGSSSLYTWTYLAVGAGLAVYGLVEDMRIASIAGLAVIVVARLQELSNENRMTAVWHSIVEKYESSFCDDD